MGFIVIRIDSKTMINIGNTLSLDRKGSSYTQHKPTNIKKALHSNYHNRRVHTKILCGRGS